MDRKPNILFLMTDEHRPDGAGFLGNPVVRTPNLDRLASKAVVFHNAYTPSPVCVPARQCLMSGQLPRTCGCEKLGEDLPPFYPTFAQTFTEHAYYTVCCGKLHHTGRDQMQGWSHRVGREMHVGAKYYPDLDREALARCRVPQDALRWKNAKEVLRAGVGRARNSVNDAYTVEGACGVIEDTFISPYYDKAQPDQPVLLKVSLSLPHYPYLCEEEKFKYYLNRVPVFEKEELSGHPYLDTKHLEIGRDITPRDLRRATAAYYAMIEQADASIGRVLGKLQEAGQDLDEWIVVFTSDHGEMLGEHGIWAKHKFYESSVRVPLMIRFPRRFAPGAVTRNVSLCDLYATLCGLCGLPVPGGLDSRDLAPLMDGSDEGWNDEAVSQWGGKYLMIKWGALKYQYYGEEMPEVLFDLSADPGEKHNAILSTEYRAVVESFRRRRAALGFGPDADPNYRNAGYAAAVPAGMPGWGTGTSQGEMHRAGAAGCTGGVAVLLAAPQSDGVETARSAAPAGGGFPPDAGKRWKAPHSRLFPREALAGRRARRTVYEAGPDAGNPNSNGRNCMIKLQDILKDGITAEQALEGLRAREAAAARPLTFAQRGAFVLEHYPQLAERTLAQAEERLRGQMVLPGSSEKHFIGDPPLWKVNPFGHAEYTFHLNRMNHWLPMLEAYSMTGEERFAAKVLAEFEDWIAACPRPSLYDEQGALVPGRFRGPDSKWWRVLECGIRLYRTWAPMVEHLAPSGLLTPALMEKLLVSVYEQGELLYRVSPLLWPKADHNHYIMENLGLLSASCMFPELRDAAAWREHALGELCRCMQAQVGETGAQIEGCPSYHNGAVFWFAMVFVYADKYGFEVPADFRARFGRMAEHSVYVTRPGGTNAPWGDGSTTTGTLVGAAVNTFIALGETEALRVCQNFYPYEKILDTVREQIWRVRDPMALTRALEEVRDRPEPPKLDTVFWDRTLSHAYLRTGWDRDAISILFACRSPIQNLHAHIDPNGFDLSAYGSPLIVDPGKYTYRDDENRRRFKSSHWHSMLTVNGRDAWEYRASWSYGPQKPGRILDVRREGRLIYAVGSHENYDPVTHTRVIAIADEKLVLVLDLLEGMGPGDTAQVNFHFDRPRAEINLEHNCVRSISGLSNATVTMGPDARPCLVPAKVSDVNDRWRDSLIARFEYAGGGGPRVLLASVILPAPPGEEPLPAVGLETRMQEDGDRVRFTALGREYAFLWKNGTLSLE